VKLYHELLFLSAKKFLYYNLEREVTFSQRIIQKEQNI